MTDLEAVTCSTQQSDNATTQRWFSQASTTLVGALPDLAIALFLLGVTLWRLIPAVDTLDFHRDEARWIGNSAILSAWSDPFGDRWQDEGYRNQFGSIDESNRRRSQPPMAMYVLGIGFLIQGRALPEIGYWIMSQDTEWNTDQGNMPTAAQLRAGRYTNIFVTMVTVLTIFWIGRRLTNRVGGTAGALLYALHPLVAITGPRAWSDPTLVLTLALATLAAIRFADRPTWARAVLVGLLLGLGGGTKLSPLVVAAGIGIIGLALAAIGLYPGTRKDVKRLGCQLLLVPIVALATFLATYPYLWPAPVTNIRRMFAFRADSFDLQQSVSPDAVVPSLGDAFAKVGYQLGARFSASGLSFDWLDARIGIETWASLDEIDLMLAILGLLILSAIVVRAGLQSPATAAVVVLGGQSLLILLTLEVLYARYLLPVVLTIAVFAGAAVGSAWQQLHSRLILPRFRSGQITVDLI